MEYVTVVMEVMSGKGWRLPRILNCPVWSVF